MDMKLYVLCLAWVVLLQDLEVVALNCVTYPSERDVPVSEECPMPIAYCITYYMYDEETYAFIPSIMGCITAVSREMLENNVTDDCQPSFSIPDQSLYCSCKTDNCNHPLFNETPPTTPTPQSCEDHSLGTLYKEKPELDNDTLICNFEFDEVHPECKYQACDNASEDPICVSLYNINPDGTATHRTGYCAYNPTFECNEDCVLSTTGNDDTPTTSAFCCCTSDYCNIKDPVLHPDHPVYPVIPGHITSEHLLCKYTNCSFDKETNDWVCVNGHVVCSEHVAIQVHGLDPHKSSHACYSTAQSVRRRSGSEAIEVTNRGCLLTITDACRTSNCTFSDPTDIGIYRCCCQGNLCNEDGYDVIHNGSTPKPPATIPLSTSGAAEEDSRYIFIAITIVIIICFVATLILSVICINHARKQTKQLRVRINQVNCNGANNDAELTKIIDTSQTSVECILMDRIGQGRFAKVWKAMREGRHVAIKVFPEDGLTSWMHEVAMYKIDDIVHPNLLQYIAHEKHPDETYWLITEYHYYGNLQDYLKREILDFQSFLNLAVSMAAGLAHLHCEIRRDGTVKPSIAHRDFKSRNVLVKSDGECCISDLGLALKLVSGENPSDCHVQVGTVRYMSPEVLQGAISFKKEAFLSIDAYALGLVLWEMTVRCNPGNNPSTIVAQYMQPYEGMVSSHPSIDEMSNIVNGYRPEFQHYTMTNEIMDSVMNTISECWDRDSEGRIPVSLVQRRLSDLSRAIKTDKFSSGDSCKESGVDTNSNHSSFNHDDNGKKLSGSGGVSDYASVDSPSPSSVNPLVSSAVLHNIPPAYSSPAERPYPTPTLPSYDNLHFHSRTTLPLSSTSGASSSTVGSTTRLLGPRSSVSQNIRLLETRETTI